MMTGAIEALYIFDQYNEPILEHVYRSRPAAARTILPQYLAHSKPRPSLIYLPNINPPTILFTVVHGSLLFMSPVSKETEPLFVLEFIHRVIDVLEEFLGSPLLPGKIEGSYDVVAQLLGEMCDAGIVCSTEPNALRDDVDTSSFLGKLLSNLPGPSTSQGPSAGLKQQLALSSSTSGPALPWRRANVRHTSNELYVDIVESLAVILAPSGRPLAAFANGSILFTSKISGVPDLLLTLGASGGKLGMEKAIELPVFHSCVRLKRWKERPGELSFVPPDGKFVLAGYEVNLMPTTTSDLKSWSNTNLQLPVSLEVSKNLGPTGSDFEVKLLLSSNFPGATAPSSSSTKPRGSGRSTPIFGSGASSSSGPVLQDLVITVPIPATAYNVTDLRASRGEAYFTQGENTVEWRVPTKDAAVSGVATLRCTVISAKDDLNTSSAGAGDDEDAARINFSNTNNGNYEENEDEDETSTYQQSSVSKTSKPPSSTNKAIDSGQASTITKQNEKKVDTPMPSSASLSFSVKGWLASGIKVDGLVVDTKRSRGLGEGVKPYKGVKYMTVSRRGVETRC